MKRTFKYLFITVFGLLGFSHLSAQGLFTYYTLPDHPFTYQECVDRSIAFDSNVGRIVLDSIYRSVEYDASRNKLLPTLGAKVQQGWALDKNPQTKEAAFNHSAWNTNFTVGFSYDIFTGLKRWHDIRSRKFNKEKNEALIQVWREWAELRAARFFYNTLLQDEIIRVAKERISQTESTLEKTKILVQKGEFPSYKIQEVKAQLERDKSFLSEATCNSDIVRVDLNVCVEYYGIEPLPLAAPNMEKLISESRLKLVRPEIIYKEALLKRPEVRAANWGLKVAKAQINAAQSGYYPSLSLNGGYSNNLMYLPQSSSSKALQQLQNNGAFFMGITLSIPIFDALQTSTAIRQAKADFIAAQKDKIDADLILYKTILKAYAEAVAAERNISSSKNAEKAAFNAVKALRKAYMKGEISTADLEQAENKFLSAQIENLKAQYNFVIKVIHLDMYHR